MSGSRFGFLLSWCVVGLALSVLVGPIGCDYVSTEDFGAEAVARCNEKCPFQNRTVDGHFDLSCDAECSMQQCALGCSLWQQGLENTCQNTCNVQSGTVFSRELYCVIGCNDALNTYYQTLRKMVGEPPAPALVPDTLSPTSLSLTWEWSAPIPGAPLSRLLQWRYEDLPGSWQYYNGTFNTSMYINVGGLTPYTKYRFRVAIFLSGRDGVGEPVLSRASVVMSTLPRGPPASPPTNVRAAPAAGGRLAVSWEPGMFTNGPLIGYVIRIADVEPNVYSAVQDTVTPLSTFYLFHSVAGSRRYIVSVAMRNSRGEGPRATVYVDTPPATTSTPQQPILILGGERCVLAAPAHDMFSDPTELFTTTHNITGVGLDVTNDYLFVSVSNNYVYRSSLSFKSEPTPILTPDTIMHKPLDLSVDWLNNHLYILGEVHDSEGKSDSSNPSWEILRFDFDGANQAVALTGFTEKPVHFEVDPYNGYIFWSIPGMERGGLYRAELGAGGAAREREAGLLVAREAAVFTLEPAETRLLLPRARPDTVLAVSLDGREKTPFRSNIQASKFSSARSIAYANRLFYWTNGYELLSEEYHEKTKSYFHNEYPIVYNMTKIFIRQVLVSLRSWQPVPAAAAAARRAGGVAGADSAALRWAPPALLPAQSPAAWQRWDYRLRLVRNDTGEVIERDGINGTSYVIEDLEPNCVYLFKVAAVTVSGAGPWSTEFAFKTLEDSEKTERSRLLFYTPDGLIQTDLTGDRAETLIEKSHLKDTSIIDVSYYRDQLYLVTNTSKVILYNVTSRGHTELVHADNVGSLAVDWVGKRLYCSHPRQQLITRSDLDGTNREPVPIVTVAKEMAIDSLNAYIYWNTGHAVEAARLNGENKTVYYPAQLFSGKQVMGIATELRGRWLYWLVRSYDGSELHRAPTADLYLQGAYHQWDSLVRRVPSTAESSGTLCVSSGRLLWASIDGVVQSDSTGSNVALLMPSASLVADRPYEELPENLIAIPAPVNASSIKVEGSWDNFTVSWQPEVGVNVPGAKVYYDVSLVAGNFKMERTVSRALVRVSGTTGPPPYCALRVVVLARSVWGAAAAAAAQRRTPPAHPAPPRALRAYAPLTGNGEVSAIFRWQVPSPSNGVIRGYDTRCWLHQNFTSSIKQSVCAGMTLPPTRRQFELKDLLPNATYFFKVRAFTDAGPGNFSETVSVSSNDIDPIPRVMLSSQEYLKIIDLDSDDSEIVPKSTGIPVDFAVSIQENIVYWVNNLEELFSSGINGSGHYKLTSITGVASSLCLDWVSRSVYWAQSAPAGGGGGGASVYRADVAVGKLRETLVLTRRYPIYGLKVVPDTRTLYWYEETNESTSGILMTSNIDGNDVKPFFNNSNENGDQCNCPENPRVSQTFVIDQSQDQYELYWVDPLVNQIIATDMSGCKCRIVLDATEKKRYGFTPMSITVDSKYIYWFNSTEKMIYFTTKSKKNNIKSIKTSFGYKIFALDVANQPYPPIECLYPVAKDLTPTLSSHSANSLTIELPYVSNYEQCANYKHSQPLVEYSVMYKSADTDSPCDEDTCQYVLTSDREVTLGDLQPFTNYTVKVEATNYYAKIHKRKPLIGLDNVFQTAAEAPKPATNLSVIALSPSEAVASWSGHPGTTYELHWSTDTESRKVQSAGSTARLTGLSSGTRYSVLVRARRPISAEHADSAVTSLTTYPPPPPLTQHNITPYNITVVWKPPMEYRVERYKVEYSEVGTPSWLNCMQNGHLWVAKDLEPSVRYRFRVSLQYVKDGPLYTWTDGDRYIFETLGDVPGPPGRLETVSLGRVVRAHWPRPAARRPALLYYLLWGRPDDESKAANVTDLSEEDTETNGLVLLHNTTEEYWLIDPAELETRYTVYVQAYNSLGGGALSPGAVLGGAGAGAGGAGAGAGLGRAPAWPASAAAAAALGAAVTATMLYLYKCGRSKKKSSLVGGDAPRPDVELATLRQLPINMPTNLIYNQGIRVATEASLSSLRHIRRDQITLNKFLGSGAFGEVFQGVARGLDGAPETRVAVKTLRKSATEQEKTEFLQEAALMSNFKHEHILRLLGVCLNNDPNYIIMELMEGGDLLSYLRAKRAQLHMPNPITLLDLLNICEDVTKGCRYLEEMHFVHRDLAARNCLVAQRPDGQTIVKIGDFGLARDIYKNDYYRKEGEGLLPVRWMAAECLVEGLFSAQSDVWAWGVLCWEVLSLGAQPYPALGNRQVLAVVAGGGRPSRPANCPHDFYVFLQRCWSYKPEKRPSFAECLTAVRRQRDRHVSAPALPALAALPDNPPTKPYSALATHDAVDNRTYLLDENDNSCLDEHYPEDIEVSGMDTPKYLELLHDDEPIVAPPRGDGYEVPRAPPGLPAPPGLERDSCDRRSVAGLAPRALVKPPLYRTHSLRTTARSPNATITPLRNGIGKRASLCDGLLFSESLSQL